MLQHVFLEIISLDAWIVALVDFGHLGKFWFMICVFSVCWRLQSIGIAEKNKLIWPGPFHEKWKVHATMMTMMMMMMTGIFTYGTNTYRYSFRRYSVRTPSWRQRRRCWWWWTYLPISQSWQPLVKMSARELELKRRRDYPICWFASIMLIFQFADWSTIIFG